MMLERQNSPLLDNGSLGTFPQQWIGLWKPKCCYKINTQFYGDADSWRSTWYGMCFCVKQATNVLHGYWRLCKWLCREEWIHSSFVREFRVQ
jgi:hypothetical protein